MNEYDRSDIDIFFEIYMSIINACQIIKIEGTNEILIQIRKIVDLIEKSPLDTIEKASLISAIFKYFSEKIEKDEYDFLLLVKDADVRTKVKAIILMLKLHEFVFRLSNKTLLLDGLKNSIKYINDFTSKLEEARRYCDVEIKYNELKSIRTSVVSKTEKLSQIFNEIYKDLYKNLRRLQFRRYLSGQIYFSEPVDIIYRTSVLKRLDRSEEDNIARILYCVVKNGKISDVLNLIPKISNPYTRFVIIILINRLYEKLYSSLRPYLLETSLAIIDDIIDQESEHRYYINDQIRYSLVINIYKMLPIDVRRDIFDAIRERLRKDLNKKIFSESYYIVENTYKLIITFDLIDDFIIMVAEKLRKMPDNVMYNEVRIAIELIKNFPSRVSTDLTEEFIYELFKSDLFFAMGFMDDVRYIDPHLYMKISKFVIEQLKKLKHEAPELFFRMLLSYYDEIHTFSPNQAKIFLDNIIKIFREMLQNGSISESRFVFDIEEIEKIAPDKTSILIPDIISYVHRLDLEQIVHLIQQDILYTEKYKNILLEIFSRINELLIHIQHLDEPNYDRMASIVDRIKEMNSSLRNEVLTKIKPGIKRIIRLLITDEPPKGELYIIRKFIIENLIDMYSQIHEEDMIDFYREILRDYLVKKIKHTHFLSAIEILYDYEREIQKLTSSDLVHIFELFFDKMYSLRIENISNENLLELKFKLQKLLESLKHRPQLKKAIMQKVISIDSETLKFFVLSILSYIESKSKDKRK